MYKGKMYCADFEENTITIEVEGEFSVRAGDYVLLSVEEYEKLSKLHQPTVILPLPTQCCWGGNNNNFAGVCSVCGGVNKGNGI